VRLGVEKVKDAALESESEAEASRCGLIAGNDECGGAGGVVHMDFEDGRGAGKAFPAELKALPTV
jgi:hypothetical protein